jgi:hypothetical protein
VPTDFVGPLTVYHGKAGRDEGEQSRKDEKIEQLEAKLKKLPRGAHDHRAIIAGLIEAQEQAIRKDEKELEELHVHGNGFPDTKLADLLSKIGESQSSGVSNEQRKKELKAQEEKEKASSSSQKPKYDFFIQQFGGDGGFEMVRSGLIV